MAQAIHHLQTQPHNRFDADDFRLTLLHATTSPAQADLTPEKRVRDTELKKTFPLNCLFILYFRTSGIAVARTMLRRTISLLLLLSILPHAVARSSISDAPPAAIAAYLAERQAAIDQEQANALGSA